ncbi:MAG: TetR/AcrR family transcriptional regulator [Firmicutes bacterium]|nr:TetR/AcrR family transcriptional regulator [Bacillota bacterium]
MSVSTKDRIREAAFSRFANQGYEATTMNDIAAGVGIKKPSLYEHYHGKDEIFLAVYQELEKDYRGYMDRVIDEARAMDETERKLYHIFERYIVYFAENIEVSAFWNRILYLPNHPLKERVLPGMTEMELGFQARIKQIIQEGMDRGVLRREPPEELLDAYYCIREGLLIAMLVKGRLVHQEIGQVWRNFWLGLKER